MLRMCRGSCPPATKKGNYRDLTKASVSLFSGSSFAPKEEPRCGARSPTLFLAADVRDSCPSGGSAKPNNGLAVGGTLSPLRGSSL